MNNSAQSKVQIINSYIDQRPVLLIGFAGLLCAIVFFVYAPTLYSYFTATDTLTLIETGRINGWQGLAEKFTQKLMAGTTFPVNYYRPISVISYGIDYWLYGLNPMGYHLTNVLLHVSVVVCIFTLTFLLSTYLRSLAAIIAAIFFGIHPVLIDNVSAISRRQDSIAALFMMLCFIIFITTFSVRNRLFKFILHFFALVMALLALFSKEVAVIVIPLICVLTFLHTYGDLWKRLKASIFYTTPYLIIFVLYLVVRILVLKDFDSVPMQLSSLGITMLFTRGLLYPVDYLQLFKSESDITSYMILPTLIIIGIVIGYTWVKGLTYFTERSSVLFTFSASLIILCLTISLLAQTFSYRYLYIPAIGISIIFAYIILEVIKSSVSKFTKIVIYGIVSFLLFPMLVHTPTNAKGNPWKTASATEKQYLEKLLQYREIIKGRDIYLYNVPALYNQNHLWLYSVNDVHPLYNYSIKSWLSLMSPEGGPLSVNIGSYEGVRAPIRKIDFDVDAADKNVAVRAKYY